MLTFVSMLVTQKCAHDQRLSPTTRAWGLQDTGGLSARLALCLGCDTVVTQ